MSIYVNLQKLEILNNLIGAKDVEDLKTRIKFHGYDTQAIFGVPEENFDFMFMMTIYHQVLFYAKKEDPKAFTHDASVVMSYNPNYGTAPDFRKLNNKFTTNDVELVSLMETRKEVLESLKPFQPKTARDFVLYATVVRMTEGKMEEAEIEILLKTKIMNLSFETTPKEVLEALVLQNKISNLNISKTTMLKNILTGTRPVETLTIEDSDFDLMAEIVSFAKKIA